MEKRKGTDSGIERAAEQYNMTPKEFLEYTAGKRTAYLGDVDRLAMELHTTPEELRKRAKEAREQEFGSEVGRFFEFAVKGVPESRLDSYRNDYHLVIENWDRLSQEDRKEAVEEAYRYGRLVSHDNTPPDMMESRIRERDMAWSGVDRWTKEKWLLLDTIESLNFSIEKYPEFSELLRAAERDALKGATSLLEIGRILDYGDRILGGYHPSDAPVLIRIGRKLEELSKKGSNEVPNLDVGKTWFKQPLRKPVREGEGSSAWDNPFTECAHYMNIVSSVLPGEALRQLFSTMRYVYWENVDYEGYGTQGRLLHFGGLAPEEIKDFRTIIAELKVGNKGEEEGQKIYDMFERMHPYSAPEWRGPRIAEHT